MTVASAERRCVICKSDIPKFKAIRVVTCGKLSCKRKRQENLDAARQPVVKKEVATSQNTGAILHTCLVNLFGPIKAVVPLQKENHRRRGESLGEFGGSR